MPQVFYMQQITPLPIEEEAGLAPEPVWTNVEQKKSLASTVIRTLDCPGCS